MTSGPGLSRSASGLILIGLWLICAVALIFVTWKLIAPMNFRDPDDALRLVQVRDLLAGQSWFDLTQHRIHPPDGVPMHWSRLVDVPIALLLWPLEKLLGQALAERIVLVMIPQLYLLATAFLTYKIGRTLAFGRGLALLSVAILLSTFTILVQFAPVRIDHHAPQIVCGAIAIWALVRTGRNGGGRGLIAGIAMACWLQISAEGLPYAVVAGGIFALHHVLRQDRWADLRSYMLALPIVATVLLFTTRYPSDAILPWCDSFSPAYLAPLWLTTVLLFAGQRILPRSTPVMRALPLMIAGAAGAAMFIVRSRDCLAGPFETLSPIVYELWYLAVREGLPLTRQKPDFQAIILVPAILGLIGTLLGLWKAKTPAEREGWLNLLVIQAAAFAISLTVMRAMAFAHLLAVPGTTVLIATMVAAAQRLKLMPVRVLASAACVAAAPMAATAIVSGLLDLDGPAATNANAADGEPDRFRCTTQTSLRGLDALPQSTLFTPLDIGAHILVYTGHKVVATGHHRNVAGMTTVLEGLTAPSPKAQGIVAGSGATYLAFCRGEGEVARYAKLNPGSLIDDLMNGQAPAWLQPVKMRPGESISVYRIIKPGG